MFSRPAQQDTPTAARCDVFPASALRVHFGVNAGDTVGSAATLLAGDIYGLSADARPALLRLTAPGPDGRRRIGLGSDIAGSGGAVDVEARLLFMAADGTRAEVLVLRPCLQEEPDQGALLMPLQPLIPGIDLALIRIDPAPGPCRLPDLTCGMLGQGARVLLADGTPRPVGSLRPGDRVLTRDHGAQPLQWSGTVTLRAAGAHAPVVIARGTLGNGDDLSLGQNCRLFLHRRSTTAGPDLSEVLVHARHFLGNPGIRLREGGLVDYVLLVFDQHEIIYAEGIAVESLRVTAALLERLPVDLGAEVATRFPGLSQPQHHGMEAGRTDVRPARAARQAPVL